MSQIHIADGQNDNVLDYITAKNIISDTHKKSLENTLETYNFITFADKSFSQFLEKRNRIIIPDEDDSLVEFVIFEAHKYRDTEGYKAQVYAHASYLELKKASIIYPDTFTGTASQHGGRALNDTGWEIGIVESDRSISITFDNHTNPYEYLKRIAREFELELDFRVQHNGTKITRRIVNLVERIGTWRGREVTFGKDLDGIRRVEKQDIVTALLGIAPEDENGNRLEVLVEDEEALQRWGRLDKFGNLEHLIQPYEIQSERSEMTMAEARQYTRTALDKRINTQVTYETTIVDLENVPGMANKKIRFGDTIKIKDEKFNPPLFLEARVFELERSVKSKGKKEIKLGDFIEYTEEQVHDVFNQLRKEIRARITRSEMVEHTYSKIEIDQKDQYTFEQGKTFAEAVRIEVEDNAKQFAIERDSALKIDVEDYADQVADQAESNAKSYAEDKSSEALQQALAESVSKDVYNQKMTEITNDLSEKAGITYVDGQLQIIDGAIDDLNAEIDKKADGGTVYTISEVDNMINNTVSITQYTTDIDGIVTDLSNQETRIGQNEEAIGLQANRIDMVEGTVSDHSAELLTMADEISAKVSADYVQTAIDDVEIGGRNLILGSSEPITLSAKNTGTAGDNYNYLRIRAPMEKDEIYTLSFNVEITDGDFDRVSLYTQYGDTGMVVVDLVGGKGIHTFKAVSDTDSDNIFIYAGLAGATRGNGMILTEYKLEKGNKATDWSPAPEDMATQSQFTQLSDNINLRVMKDDIINQINISTEDILISGNKLILDGDTTVTGMFRVSNANITSISADKMTVGTLNGANVDIININASNIKSGTLDAIDITGGRITQQSSGGRVEMYNGKIQSYRRDELAIEITGYQMKFYNSDNTEIGSIYPITTSGSGNRGIGLEVGDGAHFGIGERIDGVLYGSLGIQPHLSRTYLSGPYKGAIPGATLDLYANRRLLATDNDFSNYDQPSISLRQGQDSNDLIMYYGGANRRADAMLQVRHNFEVDSWRSMLTLDSGGLTTRYGVTINNASSVENHGLRLVVNGNNHVITGHTNTSNMIIYPQRITDQDIFRIRSHHLWGNFSNDLRIRYNGDIEGKKFVDSSLAETKENIKPWEISALDIINQSDLYEWTRGSDKKEYGFVIGEGYRTPDEVVSESGSGISNYSHRSLNTKAIQELDTKLNLTREELILKVAQLEQRINELESVA